MFRLNTLIIITVVLVSAICCDASKASDTAQFRGLIRHKVKSDTLRIHYHLTPLNFDADSVRFRIWSDKKKIIPEVDGFNDSTNTVLIYDRREGVPFENKWRKVYKKNSKLYLDGTLVVPLNGKSTKNWSVSASGFYTNSNDSIQSIWDRQDLSNNYSGVGMEFLAPSFGYFKSDHDAPLDKKGLFLGWGLSYDAYFGYNRFSLSTSFSGLGENFAFSEPFRLGYRRYFGSRSRFAPSLYGAVKISHLKLKRDIVELNTYDWGVEAGAAIDFPLERIGYHYSTGLGGYHTLELFIATVGDARTKIGTRYLLQRKENLWMIRISFHIEGLDVIAERGPGLMLENNRPLVHKILSLPGLIPSAIITAPFLLYYKITGKEMKSPRY